MLAEPTESNKPYIWVEQTAMSGAVLLSRVSRVGAQTLTCSHVKESLVVLNQHVYRNCVTRCDSHVSGSRSFHRSACTPRENAKFTSHDILKPSNPIGLPVFRTCWFSTTEIWRFIPYPLLCGSTWGSGNETILNQTKLLTELAISSFWQINGVN